jgi:hypothetical protein
VCARTERENARIDKGRRRRAATLGELFFCALQALHDANKATSVVPLAGLWLRRVCVACVCVCVCISLSLSLSLSVWARLRKDTSGRILNACDASCGKFGWFLKLRECVFTERKRSRRGSALVFYRAARTR